MPIPRHLMDQTVTIQRNTAVVGSSGSPGDVWADHIVGIPAHLSQMSGGEAVRAGRDNVRRQWTAFVDAGQDITEADRVQFTDSTSGTQITRTLGIGEVRNPHQRNHHLELACEETEP